MGTHPCYTCGITVGYRYTASSSIRLSFFWLCFSLGSSFPFLIPPRAVLYLPVRFFYILDPLFRAARSEQQLQLSAIFLLLIPVPCSSSARFLCVFLPARSTCLHCVRRFRIISVFFFLVFLLLLIFAGLARVVSYPVRWHFTFGLYDTLIDLRLFRSLSSLLQQFPTGYNVITYSYYQVLYPSHLKQVDFSLLRVP